jgi:G3E family GTPase
MSNISSQSKWAESIALYNHYHNKSESQAVVEQKEQPKSVDKFNPWIDNLRKSTDMIVGRLQSEEIVSETDAATIKNAINEIIEQFQADDKKSALLNLLTAIGVPLLIQYFLGKFNNKQEGNR